MKTIRIRTGVRAGGSNMNHGTTIRVRTGVRSGRGGGWDGNHRVAIRKPAR